nr:MAG TPA: hypothetical protein [Caudoviricetes sp.]
MAKILYKKKVYEYRKDCADEFGKYNWYFKIYICFSKVGITWQIDTSDITVNDKKLRRCLDSILHDLEKDNPRYYRLKDKIFSKNLANKLW